MTDQPEPTPTGRATLAGRLRTVGDTGQPAMTVEERAAWEDYLRQVGEDADRFWADKASVNDPNRH